MSVYDLQSLRYLKGARAPLAAACKHTQQLHDGSSSNTTQVFSQPHCASSNTLELLLPRLQGFALMLHHPLLLSTCGNARRLWRGPIVPTGLHTAHTHVGCATNTLALDAAHHTSHQLTACCLLLHHLLCVGG